MVVGQVGAAHGVKGEVRLKSFTAAPMDVAAYGPLAADDGRDVRDRDGAAGGGAGGRHAGGALHGDRDREAAGALNGLELSVLRERLPAAETDELHHADLIGLAAETASGETLGAVIAVQNYGAGDLLESRAPGSMPVLIPFTRAAVPAVDVTGGRVVGDPPPGLLEASDEDAQP